jgi:hypothetical protein
LGDHAIRRKDKQLVESSRSKTLTLAVLLLGAVFASHAIAAHSGSRSGSHSGSHGGSHAGSRPGGLSGSHPGGAHHGYGGHGAHYAPWFGAGFVYAPFYDPYYYYPPPPYYYYYSEPLMPPTAPAYIEQYPGQSAPQQSWYFCASSNAYYPYVRECVEAWQRVPAQPPY